MCTNYGYESATGPIRFTLTNDYMFHIIFENCRSSLRSFLGSLLHMQPEEILTLEVTNPIDYGRLPEDKKIILDLRMLMNHSKIINLEMQVFDDGDWEDRSVLYLCRCYDRVLRGKDYDTIMPAHLIGILDFNLRDKTYELFSTYHFRNDKTGATYGNIGLSVLNLRQIDLATAEDKKWHIDRWARLFKATTWEELRMIAANDIEMTETAKILYEKNQDMYAQSWAISREMALFDERRRKAKEKKALEELARTELKLEELQKEAADIQQKLEDAKKETATVQQEAAAAQAEAAAAQEENKRLLAILASKGIDPNA